MECCCGLNFSSLIHTIGILNSSHSILYRISRNISGLSLTLIVRTLIFKTCTAGLAYCLWNVFIFINRLWPFLSQLVTKKEEPFQLSNYHHSDITYSVQNFWIYPQEEDWNHPKSFILISGRKECKIGDLLSHMALQKTERDWRVGKRKTVDI